MAMLYPKIIDAQAVGDYCVRMEFEDGSVRVLDVKPWIRGDWYGKLSDVEYFRKVRPHSCPGSIEWPDGQDIAPEDILEFGIKV